MNEKLDNQMGKIVVIGILVATAVLGGAVYKTFKNAKSVRESVVTKLESDFITYFEKVAHLEQLEVTTIKNNESFGAQSAAVSFSYFVDLRKKWGLELHDKLIFVKAPALEFSRPVVTFSGPEFSIEDQDLRNRALANQSANSNAVLELARTKISDFVKSWLEVQFPKEKNIEVQIVFPNELEPPKSNSEVAH